ncbi:MAG TPA: septum formation initiator family protein [Gemmatimonadales bacterium]|nr:septum formation initiator family protein [Gemmatimonadales bacterium]
MSRARVIGLGAVVVGLVFAVQGGEYSTGAWLRLRAQVAEERAAVDSLTRAVDSLDALARAVASDPRTQERIARESFGLIRDGEYLIRLPAAPAGP